MDVYRHESLIDTSIRSSASEICFPQMGFGEKNCIVPFYPAEEDFFHRLILPQIYPEAINSPHHEAEISVVRVVISAKLLLPFWTSESLPFGGHYQIIPQKSMLVEIQI